MPNPYLYAVVALVVVLVVVGAYLGMMVSNEAAKATALQNQLNALKTNYTTLESQYTQLQSQYTTLQNQYNQLQAQYNELESNYTALQSQYNQLEVNYTNSLSLLNSFKMLVYESMIKPVAYVIPSIPGTGMSAIAIFFNITNPTNSFINITLTGCSNFLGCTEPAVIILPPNTTIPVPMWIALYNTTYGIRTTYGGTPWFWSPNSTTSELLNENFTIYVFTNTSNPVLSGLMYNTTIMKTIVLSTPQPMGYATYLPPDNNVFIVNVMNPLTTSITINGYSIYAQNGTLLLSCTLYQPLTINATSFIGIQLPTFVTPGPTNYAYLYIPGVAGAPSITLNVTCNTIFFFPSHAAQLPYGYVVLSTSIGNITTPLLPLVPSPWTPW